MLVPARLLAAPQGRVPLGSARLPHEEVARHGRRGYGRSLAAVSCEDLAPVTEVVLFHHALGLTPGVTAFAEELRRSGHVVHTPDLYDGRTFESLDAGLAHAEEIGFMHIIDRGVREAEMLPADVVYAGFSLGVLPAQKLAQTRPGARGALLYYSCVPLGEFAPDWPDEVPVQVHGMDADPIFVGEGDLDAARGLVESAGQAQLFLYEGDQHYFADASLPSYEPEAAALLMRRTLDFLDSAGR